LFWIGVLIMAVSIEYVGVVGERIMLRYCLSVHTCVLSSKPLHPQERYYLNCAKFHLAWLKLYFSGTRVNHRCKY